MSRTHKCSLSGVRDPALLDFLQKIADSLDTTQLGIERLGRDVYAEFSIFTKAFETHCGPEDTWGSQILELVHKAVQRNAEVDRAVGAIVGNALADAVGHPLEFIAADDSPVPPYDPERAWIHHEWVTSNGGPFYCHAFNKFDLSAGQWTDDFSMALCLADTLLVHRQYHGADARVRWYNWWEHGYNNAFRFDGERGEKRSVGLGGNISKSLFALRACDGVTDIPPFYEAQGEDAGNGSIMRLSPVPVMFHADVKIAEEVAVAQSRGTHPGNDAAASCRFITFFIIQAIKLGCPKPQTTGSSAPTASRTSTQQFVEECVQRFIDEHDMNSDGGMQKLHRLLQSSEPAASKEVCWNWKAAQLPIWAAIHNRQQEGTYNGYPILPGYWGSYCFDGLAMALWGIYHSNCFEEAVIRVVNLLGDADSTGAVVGQMAGALYGYRSIERGTLEVQYQPSRYAGVEDVQARFKTMGQCWMAHLRNWDRYSEIPLRGVLLYCLEPTCNSTGC
jgi:ADP-ribosylglycohydrolase